MLDPPPAPETRTGHPEADAALSRLRQDVRAILGPTLVGLYVYGSLALGDYDPASSDIDFLVATSSELSPEQLKKLERIHDVIAASGLKGAKKT